MHTIGSLRSRKYLGGTQTLTSNCRMSAMDGGEPWRGDERRLARESIMEVRDPGSNPDTTGVL